MAASHVFVVQLWLKKPYIPKALPTKMPYIAVWCNLPE
jgi:hypothetical protein